MPEPLGRSETSRQTYSRWFTVWPTTHVNAGQSVEVMPVAEHASFVNELLAERERAEITASHLHEALAFMRSCELSGECGADHPVVLRALEMARALTAGASDDLTPRGPSGVSS